MNIQTILVPVDFSTCALLVTQQAAGLAARLGARVVVLHVAELPAGVPPDTHVRLDGVDSTAGDYVGDDTRAPSARGRAASGVPTPRAAPPRSASPRKPRGGGPPRASIQ